MTKFFSFHLLGALAALTACASVSSNSSDTVDTTSEGLGEAVLSPLEDVNIKRDEIPIVLRGLLGPYPLEAPESCTAIAAHVRDLNAALGPDEDDPEAQEDESLGEKAGEGTLSVISSAASDIIPFRSVVRYATGATAHEAKVRAAYERGIARRAYLKGIGQIRGCEPPAAPRDARRGLMMDD